MSTSTADKKAFLQVPERVAMLKKFRKMRGHVVKVWQHPYVTAFRFDPIHKNDPPKFTADQPHNQLKPVYLKNIDDGKDWVYYNRILKVTVIDDPMVGYPALNLAVHDKNGDATRVSIYEIPQNEETCQKLSFGTEIGIVHPYYRVAMDGKPAIRVEDPSTIIILGKKKSMCRYCGEENAERKCSICKRSYCDRECQVADWKELDHKIICKTFSC